MTPAQLRPTWRNLPDKPFVDARDFGIRLEPVEVLPVDDFDNTAALNAAFASASAAGKDLFIPPGSYSLMGQLNFTAASPVDVYQTHVRYVYDGPEGSVLTWGSSTANTWGYARLIGGGCINVSEYYPTAKVGYHAWPPTMTNRVGFQLRNCNVCNIELEGTQYFAVGLELFADGAGVNYNRIMPGAIDGNTVGLKGRRSADASSYANENYFIGPAFIRGDPSILIDTSLYDEGAPGHHYAAQWTFNGILFEPLTSPAVFLRGTDIQRWSFRDCYWEEAMTWDLSGTNDICIDRGSQSGLSSPYPSGVYATAAPILNWSS